MRFVILSKGSEFHAVRRLSDAAARRGITAVSVNPNECCLSTASGRLEIRRKGRVLSPPDFVIPRIVPSNMLQGLNVLRALESLGIPSLVPSTAIELASNPARLFLSLSSAGCPIPEGAIVSASSQAGAAVKRLKAPPAWVIPLCGSESGRPQTAMYCASGDSLRAALDVLLRMAGAVLIQSAMWARGGRSLRVFVVGGKAAVCCEVLRHEASEALGEDEPGGEADARIGKAHGRRIGRDSIQSIEIPEFLSCCRHFLAEGKRTAQCRQAAIGGGRFPESAVSEVPVPRIASQDSRFTDSVRRGSEVLLRRQCMTQDVKSAAETAAAAVGAQEFASVDIFTGKSGAVVTGVCCTPGLKYVETILRIDIAGRVIEAARNTILRLRRQNH